MPEDPPPLLTKPAGVLVQFFGFCFALGAVVMFAVNVPFGILGLLVAFALLALGRQTKPRRKP
jgi:hypothetical protein